MKKYKSLAVFTFALLAVTAFSQTFPGGPGGGGTGKDSDPFNPANYQITQSVTGHITLQRFEKDANGANVQRTYTEDLATKTWSPTNYSGQLAASGDGTTSSEFQWNETFTWTIQWVGEGPAPQLTVANLSGFGNVYYATGPQGSGTASDGLGGSFDYPSTSTCSDSQFVPVQLTNGEGQASLTVSGNLATPGTIEAAFGGNIQVATRAMVVTAPSIDMSYKPGGGLYGTDPVPNTVTSYAQVQGDTVYAVQQDGSGSVDYTLDSNLLGHWGPLPIFSWDSGIPSLDGSTDEIGDSEDAAAMQQIMLNGGKKLYVSCTASDNSGLPPVNSQYVMTVHAPVEAPIRTFGQGTRDPNSSPFDSITQENDTDGPIAPASKSVSYSYTVSISASVTIDPVVLDWLKVNVGASYGTTKTQTVTLTVDARPFTVTTLYAYAGYLPLSVYGLTYGTHGFTGTVTYNTQYVPEDGALYLVSKSDRIGH